MTALRLILRRAAIVVPLLLAVTVIVFLIVQLLPGDPATAVLGEFASKEQRAEFAAANGLNDPSRPATCASSATCCRATSASR